MLVVLIDLDFNWKVALKTISTVMVALKRSFNSFQLISSEA